MVDYLKEISQYNIRKAQPDPSKRALLVIDMQRYFKPLASKIIDSTASIINTCRSSFHLNCLRPSCDKTKHPWLLPSLNFSRQFKKIDFRETFKELKHFLV